MHRLIMLSAAYQQATSATANAQRRLCASAGSPPRRFAIRCWPSAATLDLTPGQAHPFPPEQHGAYSQHVPFNANYPTNKRSVYVMRKRNTRHPFFALFDGPDPNESTPVRQVSHRADAALSSSNDPFVYMRRALGND